VAKLLVHIVVFCGSATALEEVVRINDQLFPSVLFFLILAKRELCVRFAKVCQRTFELLVH